MTQVMSAPEQIVVRSFKRYSSTLSWELPACLLYAHRTSILQPCSATKPAWETQPARAAFPPCMTSANQWSKHTDIRHAGVPKPRGRGQPSIARTPTGMRMRQTPHAHAGACPVNSIAWPVQSSALSAHAPPPSTGGPRG